MHSDDLVHVLKQCNPINPKGFPPVHLWNPEHCGSMNLIIKRDGSWWHEGAPIQREALRRIFARILRLEDDGQYVLVTPVEKITIEVEDAPLLVTQAIYERLDANPMITLHTSTADVFVLDADHPLWVLEKPITREPSPYVLVRARLHALIIRSVFYDLVNWAQPITNSATGRLELCLESAGSSFSLGFCDEV